MCEKSHKMELSLVGFLLLAFCISAYGDVCIEAVTTSPSQVMAVDADVALRGGPTPHQGRVEVLYNNTWGTVCDDKFSDNGCRVICRQLGYTGGVKTKMWGEGTGPVLLDEVQCDGTESNIGQCQHDFWGQTDCYHNEDIGCNCMAPDSQNVSCTQSRHRITPFDPAYPGIGRVEIQDQNGWWYVVCDDFWDDVDASVFCDCLGYTDRDHHRAYWSSELIDMEPALTVLYYAVHCSTADMAATRNLWECESVVTSGTCSASRESAAVACQALPSVVPPAAPVASSTCNGKQLSVCYSSRDYALAAAYLRVYPECAALQRRVVADGICIDIPIDKCTADKVETDASWKHYCFDVTYSQYSQDPDVLLMDSVWRRQACCSLAKNGSVVTQFQPRVQEQPPIYSNASVNFTITCFLDDAFRGDPVQCPANVTRGSEVFCRIEAEAWDPALYLVVPRCQVMARRYGGPTFNFLENKCPSTNKLGVTYFSFDRNRWGFKLRLPKFQGYDQLYLACDSYMCDTNLDTKPYCDRSCDGLSSRRRRRDAAQPDITKKTAEVGEMIELHHGPILVDDHGFGPLVTTNGDIVLEDSGSNDLGGSPNIPVRLPQLERVFEEFAQMSVKGGQSTTARPRHGEELSQAAGSASILPVPAAKTSGSQACSTVDVFVMVVSTTLVFMRYYL